MSLSWKGVHQGVRRQVRSAGNKMRRWLGVRPDSDTAQLRMFRTFLTGKTPGLVALRRGFHAHDYLAENEPAWLDLLNQSAEFGAWDATRLREEIVYHLLPGGAVLVSGRSEMVACAAVCDFPADAPLATLMY